MRAMASFSPSGWIDPADQARPEPIGGNLQIILNPTKSNPTASAWEE
jgi:hypothetical protein